MQSKYLLALNAHEKIGSQTLKKALAPFSNPEKLWQCPVSNLRKYLDEKIVRLVLEAREQFDPDDEIEKLQKFDLGYMTLYDKNYPSLLAEIPDAPVILYIKGDPEVLSSPCISVVGSRKYTNYGKSVAYKLSRQCASKGLTIVSGLALGIDAFAHQAAVDVGGKTIGVLGCGLDQIYPVSNFALTKEILQNGGTIITEFPPGTPPLRYNFPARNRIIAGLSTGTLVVEAAKESGALITAYQALEYNREVFAVPGNIDSESSEGANQLIKNGAKVVTKYEDIFEELNIEEIKAIEKSKKIIPQSKEETIISEFIKSEAKQIDELVSSGKINIVALNTALTIMEMKGLIENLGGGRYKLKR